MIYRLCIAVLIFTIPMNASAGRLDSCQAFLTKVKDKTIEIANMRLLDSRTKIIKLGEKPFFEGSARANLKKYLKLIYRSRPADSKYRSFDKSEFKLLEQLVDETEAGIFDSEFSERTYGKKAEDVHIRDGFEQLLNIYMIKLNRFLDDSDAMVSNYLIVKGEEGTKWGVKFLTKAIILAGLFFTIQGVGSPLWDYVAASAKRLSFKVTNKFTPDDKDSDTSVDGLRERLQDIYRKMNQEYTSVERTANGRITHVSSTLSFHLGTLGTQDDPEIREAVLRELARLPLRYSDVFESKEGQYARNIYERTAEKYDPSYKILPRLGAYAYKYDFDRPSDEKTTGEVEEAAEE
jgi:hypothetical protein